MFDREDQSTQRAAREARRDLPEGRRAAYYVGLVVIIVGFLLFFSIFLSAGLAMGSPGPMGPDINPGGFVIRAIVGMGMMIGGVILMNIGSRGLAGSGVVLDPQQARRDLEPWTRAAGGAVKDALDEAGLPLGQTKPATGSELAFDEKLRRLDRLRADGLISEDEFRQKRAEILGQNW